MFDTLALHSSTTRFLCHLVPTHLSPSALSLSLSLCGGHDSAQSRLTETPAHVGHSCGTLAGHSCVGHLQTKASSCGTFVSHTIAGHPFVQQCATLFCCTIGEQSWHTLFGWNALVGHFYRAFLWDTLAGHWEVAGSLQKSHASSLQNEGVGAPLMPATHGIEALLCRPCWAAPTCWWECNPWERSKPRSGCFCTGMPESQGVKGNEFGDIFAQTSSSKRTFPTRLPPK